MILNFTFNQILTEQSIKKKFLMFGPGKNQITNVTVYHSHWLFFIQKILSFLAVLTFNYKKRGFSYGLPRGISNTRN